MACLRPSRSCSPRKSSFATFYSQPKIGAGAWFRRREAGNYEIYQQSFRSGEEVLTILTKLAASASFAPMPRNKCPDISAGALEHLLTVCTPSGCESFVSL